MEYLQLWGTTHRNHYSVFLLYEFTLYAFRACKGLIIAVWVLSMERAETQKKTKQWKCSTHIYVTCLFPLRFSWGRFRKFVHTMFPILNWLCIYRIREWLLGDVHAGISVGLVQIPQGKQRKTLLFLFSILSFLYLYSYFLSYFLTT